MSEEPRHDAGQPGRWRRVADTEPRVLGLPRSWFGSGASQLDLRWLRHPIRWMRWRRQLRRLGPYAADYDERRDRTRG